MGPAAVLQYWARVSPERVAIRFHDVDITWRALERDSGRVAAGLLAAGLRRGDRIGVLSANCPEFVVLEMACARIGAIIVPLNIRLTSSELSYIVEDAGCSLLFTDAELGGLLLAEKPPAPIYLIGDGELAGSVPFSELAGEASADPVDVGSDETLVLSYTSGTTGFPKGVMLTHGNVMAVGQSLSRGLEMTSADRVLLPFPLAFTGGIIAVLTSTLTAGARLVLERKFDAERVLSQLEQERISVFLSVPAIYQQLAELPGFDRADLSSLRVAVSGGATVPESLLSTYADKGVAMTEGYGLTEASAFDVLLPPALAREKLGSCGLPLMHVQARLVGEDGETPTAIGEVGQVALRGPQVMKGYWEDPAATAAVLREDGWLLTGDLATVDADGCLTIVDRLKDMIISGGINVYPAEIERTIAAVPGVREVAVIGVPDARWAEVAAAIIVGEDVSEAAVRAACGERLADFKRPRHLVFSSRPLPRNMSGKVLNGQLRESYAAALAAGAEPAAGGSPWIR